MRLLVFTPYYPPHTGGLENHAKQFNQQLAQRGCEITVFTTQIPPTAPSYEQESRIKIIRFPAFEIIPSYPLPKVWKPVFWRQYWQIAHGNHDIVISRTRFFITSLLAVCTARYKRKPLVHIEHGSDYVQLNNRVLGWITKLYDHTAGRLVLRYATRIIANSYATAEFVKQLASRPSQVIYRGVDMELIASVQSNADVRLRYPTQTIVIFVGRLIDGKGVPDLLAVLHKLSRSDVVCFVVGDGPQKEKLQKMVSTQGQDDKVIFWGDQSHEQTIALLKAADIFVNPSYTEGLPTSVIEAALCKTAIIATNVGGTNEIITHQVSGWLTVPRDQHALCAALDAAITQPELRKAYGEAAALAVKNKFTWSSSSSVYLAVFRELL